MPSLLCPCDLPCFEPCFAREFFLFLFTTTEISLMSFAKSSNDRSRRLDSSLSIFTIKDTQFLLVEAFWGAACFCLFLLWNRSIDKSLPLIRSGRSLTVMEFNIDVFKIDLREALSLNFSITSVPVALAVLLVEGAVNSPKLSPMSSTVWLIVIWLGVVPFAVGAWLVPSPSSACDPNREDWGRVRVVVLKSQELSLGPILSSAFLTVTLANSSNWSSLNPSDSATVLT